MKHHTPNHRPQRVGESIRRLLGSVLLENFSHIACFRQVVITEVRMTPDLRLAMVYYRLLTPQVTAKEMKQHLTAVQGPLRHTLAQKMQLRYMPQLKFMHDTTADSARRIDALLQQVANSQETLSGKENF